VKQKLQTIVWDYYKNHGRHDLPWRAPEPDGSFDPYKILVSEIMLQQTQVPRVIPKYHEFLRRFPTFTALADASLGDVLRVWNGLGYNRRAKFLWQAAQRVVAEYGGQMPSAQAELVALPGVGVNTAGAVLAYAFNQPAVFVETNIRSVFIHHFFADQQGVTDKQIAELVAQTMSVDPRTWYWALMDYGTYLKQTSPNLNSASKHYVKQSQFEGSRRQVRGHVLRLLGAGAFTIDELIHLIPDERTLEVIKQLAEEGFIHLGQGGKLALA
jgi:A/G-specific adenine glycosylase